MKRGYILMIMYYIVFIGFYIHICTIGTTVLWPLTPKIDRAMTCDIGLSDIRTSTECRPVGPCGMRHGG